MRSVAFFVAWILACLYSVGQTLDKPLTQDNADSIATSIPAVAPDSTLVPNDSIPKPLRSVSRDIETTINYHARDSMFFDLSDQNMIMYGDTHIDYGQIQLDAERTEVNWIKRTIQSDFVLDSAGNKSGKPVFTDREDIYVTEKIIYDFKSQKAQISGVVTEQDGAFMHGQNVRKNEYNEMFISGALYTTCNLGDPHFFIEANKLKVIPGNKVVSGPFHLKFREVPTPLWGPFGMFPQPKQKSSGIVMPVYGEEQRRGFFLRDGGYYFAVSDYMDLRVTGDIYSKGGHALNFNQNYIKRYAYRGTFNFSYTKNVEGNLVKAGEINSYAVMWNHTPQSKGNSRFSASVNARSNTYNANNNLLISNYQTSIQSNFTSNISYSTKFQGTPYSMTANLRHNQNIQTEIVTLTLPDLTLNMTRIYPFKGLTKNSNSPLAKLNLSHTFSAKNELTNAPRGSFDFDVANEYDDAQDTLVFNGANFNQILDRSKLYARHSVPISTSLNVLKYFTLSPSFNYEEVWYNRELKFTDYDEAAGGVRVDTVDGFSRAGSWRSSASLNTRLFGMYQIGWKNIQAIRHVITPSVSFSYNPDFGDTKYGVYSDVVVDENGKVRRLSKYLGFPNSPPIGESRTMSFGVTNNFEMKVLDKKDSTGESYKKIKLLDNLSANSGYNFAADSFKLSNIGLSARTSFFQNKLTVQTSATLDPYIYRLISETETSTGRQVVQRRLDRYAWNNGQGLGQLSSLNTSINFNLQGKSKSTASQNQQNQFGNRNAPGQFGQDPFADPNLDETQEDREIRETIQDIQNNPDLYVNFNLPWSLRTSYTITRRKTGFEDPTVKQVMTFGGSLGLTDKTQVTFNSGYDFDSNQFTSTRIGVHRDLHCWTLDFNWVPFGTYQSYFLTLRVKSPILQDLKVEKKRSFFDFFGN